MALDYQNPLHEPTRKRRGWKTFILCAVGIIFVFLLILFVSLPSITQSRESENRAVCATHLRWIGEAASLYAHDHHGQLPPDLGTLLQNEDISTDVFLCPSSDMTKATGATTQETMALLVDGKHVSYAWTGAGLTNQASADIVVAFDLEMHMPVDATASTSGINVLLGDGSVTFASAATAKAIWAQYHAGVRPIRLSTCAAFAASAATMPASSP